ncbi:UNVERIFIED_CONTAM: hypothetical protein Sangu_2106700 [Sesamum angustifolium]|uniref:Retrotransposon Copia-like N-terminal domain-containing protein n=1 Tax=Sesamum angustifolium TaxID=2727405 RepID=A0AAW2LK50_9LAMI
MASTEHKTALGTTVKLSGQNYILWSQAFKLFLGSQNKLHHILTSPPPSNDAIFPTWQQADYSVMTWLLNSMEESTRKAQWEDFLVAKFLSGLDNSLKVVRDHLLASDSVPTLSNALARVLRVATGSTDSVSSSGTTTESSAMAVRGRARPSSMRGLNILRSIVILFVRQS